MDRVLRLLGCLLLAASLPWARGAVAEEPGDREYEPLARDVVFADPAQGRLDPETDREIRDEIQRAFASLGSVVEARALLVQRYGLVCVPALADVLHAANNVPEVWNTLLTVGALRDQEGPAFELSPILRPLVKVLQSTGDPHTNGMAALALGCFHYHQAELPERYREGRDEYVAVPGVAVQWRRGAEALLEGRRELARQLEDPSAFTRIAATFALAKMGGREAAREFLSHDAPAANPEPRRARLLARAFLAADDAKAFERVLWGVESKAAQTNERASAALAVAVATLQEIPPDWAVDTERVLRHLRGTGTGLPEERAERIFAEGACAWLNQDSDAWRALWDEAVRASAEDLVATAAAQILVHCPDAEIGERMLRAATGSSRALKPSVLSLVLLRTGESGQSDGLASLAEWLRVKSKRPAPDVRWDPRWYAAIGLLRALHAGRIKPQPERQLVVDALRKAAGGTLDKDAGLRAVLSGLLEVHGDRLVNAEEGALYRLPRPEVDRAEASFVCRYGLLTADPVDACVLRLNAMVADIFGLENIPPWKAGGEGNREGQPQRFLKRYLEAYPYFSRLEFRTERGRRPAPALAADAKGIDR
ncbi:MAG: hypothetical protein O2894_07315 [Planctomycetota bacterium]|nr:hypothetical protein [Planctomycetota bacterium]